MTGLQRWAVIGTGAISRTFVQDLSLCDGVEIAVVHSRDATKAANFAAEFSVPHSTANLDLILADDGVDVLYVATPFATHRGIVEQALQAGKHVLVEKPMALTEAEVIELFEIAKAQEVFLMEAMWMKFNPAFRRLRSEVEGGRIGEVRNVRAAFSFPFPESMGTSRWDPRRSPGSLLDQGIYPVTLAHCMLGTPESVQASGMVRENGVDEAQHYTLEFSAGRFAQCVSGMTEFSDPSASVSGTGGWITLPAPFWFTTDLDIHATGAGVDLFTNPEKVRLPREGNGYLPMIRSVAKAVQSGLREHPEHTASDTIAVFRTLDAIRASFSANGPTTPAAFSVEAVKPSAWIS
ncbi:Gfo/Idh/MocA family protein [Arthrobacter sp. MMS24-T111]